MPHSQAMLFLWKGGGLQCSVGPPPCSSEGKTKVWGGERLPNGTGVGLESNDPAS